ncbi:MAG: SDR family NAD(P)-dependent oxidoreductase [Bacteroidales bacterium]|nr:SDR family NAD(P)-dependent oxidoreductase [Bacteroidales bacterium]
MPGEILQRTAKCRVILTGRSSAENLKEKQSVLTALRAIRSDVEYRQLDIDNLQQVKQCIDDITLEYKQINGIVHCAGMTSDSYILKKTSPEFNQVLNPKVSGTFNLDMASAGVDLDFFVLFSSVSSSFGNVGQADYASANGFMDQFASYRNRLASLKLRKGKTLSVNWPLWSEGGMRPDGGSQEALQQTTGMYAMSTATGMQAFYKALELPYSQILVLEGALMQLKALLQEEPTIYAEPAVSAKEQPHEASKKIIAAADPASLEEKTQDYLRKQFSALLKLAAQRIDVHEPLEKYGIDSILAMSLTNQLEKTFGSLPKTLFFEYQTLRELTSYFIESYADKLNAIFATANSDAQAQVNTVKDKPESTTQNAAGLKNGRPFRHVRHMVGSPSASALSTEPIAIVGLSGRYPLSDNIEAYWKNLRDGKDCITEIPASRWNWREYYSTDRDKSGHHFSKWGRFITGVDEFDPRFFNISPREAVFIDPQERLFLQHAWMAVEDAGLRAQACKWPTIRTLRDK